MNTSLAYFSKHGRITDPGEHAKQFDHLPRSVPQLVRLVQGVTLHVFWAERYGYAIPPARQGEVQLRTVPRRLARTLELDPRPLTEPRPVDKRLIGNCRDFSVLLTALLRHQGLPARARCGFGAYFLPNHFEDHWVAEYWNETQNRWILVDAQLDQHQSQALKIAFDPLDVPRDQFIVGGRAWQMCRSGRYDPETFGIFDMHGLGFVRGNLVRDVASLNKVELLPWDCWGIILEESLDEAAGLSLLDSVAGLSAGDVPEFEALQATYENDPRLRMEGSLLSFVDGAMQRVTPW
jgi:hypothetical protein